jgi:hypothetical protein
MKLSRGLITGALAVLSGSAFAFVNAGFETGDFTGWTVGFTPNGTTAYQSVDVFDTVAGVPSRAATFEVGEAVFQNTGAGVILTQVLSLAANTTYVFSFNWAARNPGQSDNVDGGTFSGYVNGALFSTQDSGYIAAGQVLRGTVTATFTTTTAGNYVVGAQITRKFITGAGLRQYVDNFDIVPEPGTLLALGAGLAALAARRRSR